MRPFVRRRHLRLRDLIHVRVAQLHSRAPPPGIRDPDRARRATPAVLRRGVSRDALGIATIGAAIGGVGAWSFQRSLEAVVYGISPGDPVTWLTMISIVVAMTILAAWRPCQRAARMNPVELFRQD